MDKIFIHNMEFYGYHGLFPEENRLGQRFFVSLVIEMDLKAAGQTDDMDKSVDYGVLYAITKEIVEGEAKKLIEAVAENIASSILQQLPQIKAITVKIDKPSAPIPGLFDSVGVEIYRENENE
jgi:7,8-dihydroneopterin aldolase/epimerase/oxygenase